ncbi:MAG: alkaline phosphatase family protein [Actinobacteria bacterium]|nr:alkaline phosphatase family protein [Actinomycetota bacterium]
MTTYTAAGPSLADVGTSAAAALGVPGFTDRLGIGPCRQVVVCLIDGLGWQSLLGHPEIAPRLTAMAGLPIRAVFPTTTPVGLGSLGTGLLPGAHGLVGASFRYPETGELLTPLHWGGDPVPVAVQPETTVFESVARSGIRMTSVSPAAYRESGLTRAVLRGADYAPADDVAARVAAVTSILAAGEPSYTYVYWPELDRIGHEFGVDSGAWRKALARADMLVGRLLDELVPGSAMVVTADHGMIDCPAEERISLDDDPLLMAGVERIAGEPRARHIYLAVDAVEDVQAAWRAILGDRATVLTRTELVDGGYFGPVDGDLADRIGDLMAIARGNTLLASHFDATVSRLLGQHGGLTSAEVDIPALVQQVG